MTRHEQKKNIMSNAKLVGNKQNKHNTGTHLSYAILYPLCDHHQRKQMKTKFTQFSMSIAYCQGEKASTKCGHFIAQVNNI